MRAHTHTHTHTSFFYFLSPSGGKTGVRPMLGYKGAARVQELGKEGEVQPMGDFIARSKVLEQKQSGG